MASGPDQKLVVYGSGDGIVYDTAYTNTQASEAMNRCVQAHGHRARVRTIPAYKRPVKEE